MKINQNGSIVTRCFGCDGALSTFTWKNEGANSGFGAILREEDKLSQHGGRQRVLINFRLFKCGGCGFGALGVVEQNKQLAYPSGHLTLLSFYPKSEQRLILPKLVPVGIKKEFSEAEKCFENSCFRAAAGLFRSVLDKAMRANGYNTKETRNLYQQIEAAAKDGVITQARKRKAHDEVRVLGNDVLHEEWKEIPADDVEASRLYCHRILEDFYDDRESVEKLLNEAGRHINED